MVVKCLDSYILWEISRGNPAFLSYLNGDFVIADLTLAEFYGVLLREFNEATAHYWLMKLRVYAYPVPLDTLANAVKFRLTHKPINFSFFDAVGYTFAKENHMVFVTGDKEFKDFANVEFVPVHKKH